MKNKSGFEKFIKGKKKAGTVREEIRQEKRKVRKEIEEKKKARYQFQNPEYKPQHAEKSRSKYPAKKARVSRDQSAAQGKDFSDPRKSKFSVKKENTSRAPRAFEDRNTSDRKPSRAPRAFEGKNTSDRKPSRGQSSFESKHTSDRKPSRDQRTFEGKTPSDRKPSRAPRAFEGRSTSDRKPSRDQRSFEGKNTSDRRPSRDQRTFEGKTSSDKRPSRGQSSFESKHTSDRRPSRPGSIKKAFAPRATPLRSQTTDHKPQISKQDSDQMPLNKYIAHCGICSRRDAAEIVKSGKVKVNGDVITEPGHKVSTDDDVSVAGKKVHPVKNLVYILLNKPKDYITTTDDPQNRKTVLDLIKQATQERVYPVGRLDRNTSGVLLLTNDGDLSQKLTHPSNEIRKIYSITLDKPLEKGHFDHILKGVELEDGMAHVDVLAYTDAKDKTQIGVEIHTGRNRIVRRIFESFGYNVKNLDRVMFAGLTKKNVERGKWRFLNEREVRELKYFRKGK